ncbi:MAG: DUF4258 domain-containing protein [Acidobacteria bacterium]|nr:DUF4258 domain-containing protein [Acidobacteriota bacterium]
MPRSRIERIREKIRLRQYDMTAHAAEEMAEDNLEIVDIEHAVLTGRVAGIERNDPRGSKYVIEGMATDGMTQVGAVGRFAASDRYLIITVYEITAV